MATPTDPDENTSIQDLYDREFAKPISGSQMEEHKERAQNDSSGGSFFNPEDERAEGIGSGKSSSPTDLKDAEEKPDDTVGEGYTPDPGSRRKGLRGYLKKKAKTTLIVMGLPAIVVIVGLILLLVFANSLKLVDLSEHVAAWQFARVARNASEHTSSITTEDALISAGEKSDVLGLKSFTDSWGSMFDTLNNYRPNAILNDLQGTGRMEFESTREAGNLWKKKVTAVILDGERVPVGSTRWQQLFHPVESRTRRLTANDSILTWLDESGLAGRGPIIRGAVAKAIRARYGIALKWWQDPSKFNNKDEAEAAGEEAVESEAEIAGDSQPVPASTSEVNDASNSAENTIKACLEKPACAEDAAANGGVKAEYAEVIKSIVGGAFKKAVSWLSPGSIFVPLCLIYDGSLDNPNASQQLNANSQADQRAFYALETSADQQKYGDTNGSAVGAMADKLGNITQSVPERRADGFNVNTAADTAQEPEQAATGQFNSIASSIPVIGSYIDDVAAPLCPKLTNIWFNAIGAALLALPIVGELGGTVVDSGIKEGLDQFLQKFFDQKLESFSFNAFAKRLGVGTIKLTGLVAGIGIATIFASYIVHNKLVASDTALSTGPEFDEAADAGGDLNAQEEAQLLYGRPMTNAEVATSRASDQAYRSSELDSESFSERYLAITNPDSLANHLASDISSQFNRGIFTKVVDLLGDLLSPLSSLVHIAGSLSPRALAASADTSQTDTQDYGILQWGWTDDEEDLVDDGSSTYPRSDVPTDPNTGVNYSYAPIENQDSFNNREYCLDYTKWFNGKPSECADWEHYSTFIEQYYSECFGHATDQTIDQNTTIADLLTEPDINHAPILRDDNGNPTDPKPGGHITYTEITTDILDDKGHLIGRNWRIDPSTIKVDNVGLCSPDELSYNNTEGFTAIPIDPPFGDIVFRYRLNFNYEEIMDQLDGIQNSKNTVGSNIQT